MKSPKIAPPRKPHSYADYMRVQDLRTRINNGYFPSTHEAKITGVFLADDFVADVSGFATEVLFTVRATDFDALKQLSEGTVTIDLLRAARDVCTHADDKQRIHMYLCAMGDHAAVLAEVMEVLGMDFASSANFRDAVYRLTFVLGCVGLGVGRHHPLGDIDALRAIGEERLGEIYRIAGEHRDAVAYATGRRDDDPVDGEDELYAALRGAAAGVVAEGRAEIDTAFVPVEAEVYLKTKMVLPSVDIMKLPSTRRDQARGVTSIAGVELPIPAAPSNIADWLSEMQADFPHLDLTLERIASYICQFDAMASLRLLFVGPPGGGKTELAKAVAESLQIPSLVYPCGGAADGSYGGTSSQYGTARPSTALHAVALHGCAAPLIVLDEMDKIASGNHNGSLADSLLGFLEPSTAKRLMDPLLEREVDLSGVSYIATANDLGKVPAALRDRFRIIDVPPADWKHIGPLSTSIIRKIEQERGMQRGMIEDLAGDEISLIKPTWKGGSLRKLRQVIEVMIQTREQLMGRH